MLQRYNVEFNTPNIFVIIFALRNIFNVTCVKNPSQIRGIECVHTSGGIYYNSIFFYRDN